MEAELRRAWLGTDPLERDLREACFLQLKAVDKFKQALYRYISAGQQVELQANAARDDYDWVGGGFHEPE